MEIKLLSDLYLATFLAKSFFPRRNQSRNRSVSERIDQSYL